MTISMYDASVPILINVLTNMRNWLEKADAQSAESTLLTAKLAEDMRPFTAQYQMASDSAKNGVARLAAIEAPSMPDTEASFADLKARCDKTIAFIKSIDPSAFESSADREVVIKFPNGHGYSFNGLAYLTGFMLPNFFFHATTAYALLRSQGIVIGKPDFLAHLGPPNITPAT
jgi:hypothetical protein